MNTQFIDPVCGMSVNADDAAGSTFIDGNAYYFCSDKCKKSFIATPEKYLEQTASKSVDPKISTKDTVYSCPMHPEVQQIGPGACPKCGMALEPKGGIAQEGDESELKDMTKRLVVSAIFAIPLFCYR